MTIETLRVHARNFIYRIGRCAKCMRDALIALLAGWAVLVLAVAAFVAWGQPILLAAGLTVAVVTTLLFGLHIAVAGWRGARAQSQSLAAAEQTNPLAPVPVLLSRRAAFARFARMVGAASATALAVAAAPTTAQAKYCIYIGTECPWGTICCGDKRYSPMTPYCCPNGSYCDGQGGCIAQY